MNYFVVMLKPDDRKLKERCFQSELVSVAQVDVEDDAEDIDDGVTHPTVHRVHYLNLLSAIPVADSWLGKSGPRHQSAISVSTISQPL